MKKKERVPLTGMEIKNVDLKILKYVANFCEENKINYVLSDGTLIGAVRHKGFIPWDLDIDISMLRPDYEKFIELWKDTENYVLETFDKTPQYVLPFAKVVDMHTIAYEYGMKSPCGGGFIDIFPLDAVPNDENEIISHNCEVEKMHDALNRIAYISRKKNIVGRFLRRIKYFFKFGDFSIFWENIRVRYERLMDVCLKYKVEDCNNVTNNMVISIRVRPEQRKYGFPRTALTDFMYAPFEDSVFRIPRNYDSVLKSYYGDYMTLPPVEKRKDHHNLEIFWI